MAAVIMFTAVVVAIRIRIVCGEMAEWLLQSLAIYLADVGAQFAQPATHLSARTTQAIHDHYYVDDGRASCDHPVLPAFHLRIALTSAAVSGYICRSGRALYASVYVYIARESKV